MRELTIVALLVLCCGCAIQIGTVERDVASDSVGVIVEHDAGTVRPIADSTCKGILILFGDVEAPCGLSGGRVSLPAASAAVEVVREAASAVLAFFGRGQQEPVEIILSGSGASDVSP